jgi:hypothetical protein
VDAEGDVTIKANADMDLAIDAILQSRNLDRIILLSGDGDFSRLVLAMQNRGCRVEIIGFKYVSQQLKEVADYYLSGYLIPGLLPQEEGNEITRGYPVSYWPEKGFGFMRYLTMTEEGLEEDELFFHRSHLVEDCPPGQLTNTSNIFEFNIVPSTVKEGEMMASNIKQAYRDILI